jgi:Flp pilus assembly pilin Flp
MSKKLIINKGQTLMEFAFILALVAVVSIAILIQLGKNVQSGGGINSQLQAAQLSH